jgi:hypothetical protein
VICLIPVSRFRVRYEVGAGRPYSQLEAMVLQAIMGGVRDIESMRATFQVHPRILIEALVTLTQAGWVSFSSQEEGGFLLTAEGAAAMEDSKSPSTAVITSRIDTLLLERVTGSLISNEDVRFKTRAQLKAVWDDAVRLRAVVHEGEVDEGQVRQLLRRRQGEWVRWVGPIDLIGKNAHWVPVSVDTVAGALVGLPDRWRTRLGPEVLNEARRREGTISPEARARQWVAPTTERSWGGTQRDEAESDVERAWPVSLAADDVLWDGASHEAALLRALAEAVSSIFVASAFLNSRTIEILKEPILGALRRGVDVDLLWGYGDGSDHGSSALEELKKIAYTARRDGLPGALRFNRDASGSHAKVLLFDASGTMQAVIGSYNWLSASGKGEATNVSVRLKHPGIIADACACAAGLWAAIPSESLSSTPDRWRSIASEQERIAAGGFGGGMDTGGPENSTARLVFDRDHDAIVREWSATAQERLLILSHRLGPAAETRLMRTEPIGSRKFAVRYGLTQLSDEWVARIETLIQRAGGRLVQEPGMHAKVMVSDASVCVSSYNFLFGRPVRYVAPGERDWGCDGGRLGCDNLRRSSGAGMRCGFTAGSRPGSHEQLPKARFAQHCRLA